MGGPGPGPPKSSPIRLEFWGVPGPAKRPVGADGPRGPTARGGLRPEGAYREYRPEGAYRPEGVYRPVGAYRPDGAYGKKSLGFWREYKGRFGQELKECYTLG